MATTHSEALPSPNLTRLCAGPIGHTAAVLYLLIVAVRGVTREGGALLLAYTLTNCALSAKTSCDRASTLSISSSLWQAYSAKASLYRSCTKKRIDRSQERKESRRAFKSYEYVALTWLCVFCCRIEVRGAFGVRHAVSKSIVLLRLSEGAPSAHRQKARREGPRLHCNSRLLVIQGKK